MCLTSTVHDRIVDEISENVVELKYFGTTLANQNCFHKEIKNVRLMACFPPVGPEFSSSNLLSKNIDIKIYRTIIFPFLLYGFGTWSHIKGRTQTEGDRE